MIFNEFGDRKNPTILILHGGGLSSWAVEPIAEKLKDRFYVITPIIDGHGKDGENDFKSIRHSAENILKYIDDYHSGIVHGLCGLSIGGQIVVDVLSLRDNICQYSIIESALTIPSNFTKFFLMPVVSITYPLIKLKWYSKIQAKHLLLPSHMIDKYYIDSCRITKKSLKNILYSNSSFVADKKLKETKSKVLILVGNKEITIIKRSAKLLSEIIPNSKAITLSDYGHGELSQMHPAEYSKMIFDFMK